MSGETGRTQGSMEEGDMYVGRCHRSSLKAALEGKTSKEGEDG